MLVLRIIEKLLIIYFSIYFIIDIILFVYALYVFRKKKWKQLNDIDYTQHSISVIVPAFNEEVSIVQCIKMLLNLNYDEYEVIVINDGSSDKTTKRILEGFPLHQASKKSVTFLKTNEIREVYRTEDKKLVFIDKENGGKADAVNTGINYSEKKYICTIDADSILDKQALKKVICPMVLDERVIVSGGQLAASNDVVIKNNEVISSKMPRNIWVLWQILEYIKTFMISRIGLSRINSLLVMSGAFSIYNRENLISIGGFLTSVNDNEYIIKTLGKGKNTVTEDMEIVIRLWRYFRDQKIKAKAVFLPSPVCWTEVPDNAKNLYKQRVRWHLGLLETLLIHRHIIFEPKYKSTGLLAMPYYFFFELMSPLVKVITIIFLIFAFATGILNAGWVVLLLISVLLTTAIIMSTITAIIESWSHKQSGANREALRYNSFIEWLWLVIAGIIGDFSYAFFRTFAQFMGIIKYFKPQREWNKFERKGVKTLTDSK